jgi:hypothetical protein
MFSSSTARSSRHGARLDDGGVPAADGIRAPSHRELFDLGEVRPEVVALHAVDAEGGCETDDVGELRDVASRGT